MATKKYLLKPALGTIKQGFSLEDEDGNVVYSAKMLKFKLLGASPFEFVNNVTNTREEHTVGKTVTTEESGPVGFFSTKSSFKYDDQKIWDYLHKKGVRINSSFSGNKLGMTYQVSFEGKDIATIASSTPKGKSLITTDMYYDVTTDEKDLDLVFLVAFAIAKTEQTFYD
jgi:hypothetical protein